MYKKFTWGMGAAPTTSVAPGAQKSPNWGEEPWAPATDRVGGPSREAGASLQGMVPEHLPHQGAQLKVSTTMVFWPTGLEQKHSLETAHRFSSLQPLWTTPG